MASLGGGGETKKPGVLAGLGVRVKANYEEADTAAGSPSQYKIRWQ